MKKFNKLYFLYISIALIVVFAILSNWFDWAYTAMAIAFIYPVALCLVMIGCAIKNTIKYK